MKITLSKSQWEMIGSKTGWIKKKADDEFIGKANKVYEDIMSEIERQAEWRQKDPTEMNIDHEGVYHEPENYDSYNKSMPAKDQMYQVSLIEPYVNIKKSDISPLFMIYLVGNNEPSSAQAGIESRKLIGTLDGVSAEYLSNMLKKSMIRVSLSSKTYSKTK